MHVSTKLLATASALLTIGTSALAAVEADPRDQSGETIVVTGSRYDEAAIVSATKTETPLRDVPQSITVITRDFIDDQAMRSIGDILRYVPGGFAAQGEGHRDQIVLRGNNSTSDFFVDGLRDDVQFFRDLYNAERVEVLKGANAMIFGRGGGGGVVNRVIKKAEGEALREVTLQAGSFDQYRATADLGGQLFDNAVVRLNGLYENSGSYRDFVDIERIGINPTATVTLSDATRLRVGYEYFDDERTVDRGVPSFAGRPFGRDRAQFFGNPELSHSEIAVHLVTAAVEHDFAPNLRLHSRALFGDYDKFYQNIFPASPVSGGNVNLAAYNSATERRNLFSQTDLVWDIATGPIDHVFLFGFEIGRQDTDNLRNEGNFSTNGGLERLTVPVANAVSFAPVSFTRTSQSNSGDVSLAALYVQDQLTLSDQFKVIAGLRYDRFDLDFDNSLNGARFSRADNLVSPRVGLIFKPAEPVSLYASYSLSYLPQSGDQFNSLDLTSSALEAEEFENLEVGLKWDLRPGLSFTAAAYRLDRTNTRAPGPVPGTTVLTGRQRSKGLELGLSGSITKNWAVLAGLAYQNAEITATTSAAPAGRKAPLVPETTLSLWSSYRLSPMLGFGAGVTSQSKSFASISNAVTLPGHTRVDAAIFFALSETLEAQLNIENIFDDRYFSTAHNDNNITPGSPRAVRASVTTRF